MSARRPTTPEPRLGQAGFSMIELLVAMTVTLIITGAMYGLLAGGQNAFRREPELTDRQQAIRMGMDRLQRDVTGAGERMGIDSQVFARNLNGAGTLDSPAGGKTDILEFVTVPSGCPDMWVDRDPGPPGNGEGVYGGGNSVNVMLLRDVPSCMQIPGLFLVLHDNGATKPGWASNGPADDRVTFNRGQNAQFPEASEIQDPSADIHCGQGLSVDDTGGCAAPNQHPQKLLGLALVRYLIWPDTDGIPSLWRSDKGGRDAAGDYVDPPDPAGNWRLVARGVEDLQVQYRVDPDDPTLWNDDPGLVAVGDTGTVVREVRVVLGARTVAANIAGARTSATETAVRGQLEATMAPRAALFNLAKADVWH